MHNFFSILDNYLITRMRTMGLFCVRWSLGIIFVWFGALKILGLSPVGELIQTAYAFLPAENFIIILGIIELFIGGCLLTKKLLRIALGLLWIQMAGTLMTFFLAPSLMITGGNPLLLTMQGEFVVKNLVFIAASIVIGGYIVKPKVSHHNLQ